MRKKPVKIQQNTVTTTTAAATAFQFLHCYCCCVPPLASFIANPCNNNNNNNNNNSHQIRSSSITPLSTNKSPPTSSKQLPAELSNYCFRRPFHSKLLILFLFVLISSTSISPVLSSSASQHSISGNNHQQQPGSTFSSSSPSPSVCTFEPTSQLPAGHCPKWSFLNSDQLQQQQQEEQQHQQQHSLLLHPDVSNVGLLAAAASSSSTAQNVVATSNNQNNFYVVLSGGGNASNHYAYYQAMLPSSSSSSSSINTIPAPPVAMLVSSFWEHTMAQCELYFRYRVLGALGAELLVATEQLSLRLIHPNSVSDDLAGQFGNGNNGNGAQVEEDDEDWTRPTLRARFEPGNPPLSVGEPWAQARVSLGQFNFPTRIRVECHSANNNNNAANYPPHKYGVGGRVADGATAGEPLLSVECSVDDLQLVNCAEEEWHGTLGGAADKFDEDVAASQNCPAGRMPCRSVANTHNGKGWHFCLRNDQICDMHPDCEASEDELEQLHKCSQVPDGARCDFEDLRWLPAGCAHWRFFSSQTGGNNQSPTATNNSSSSSSSSSSSHSSHSSSLPSLSRLPPPSPPPSPATTIHHLVSLADAQTRRPGIPPGEYWHNNRPYRPGHFLFFSSYDHPGSGQHDIIYSFAMSAPFSVAFPPFQQHQQPEQQQNCSLRFFYCQTGFSPFQVFLQRRDQPQELAKPLWAPPRDEHVREPCEWHRAAVQIHRASLATNGEYALKLSFAKLAGSLGSIAIDDLSLSPHCFATGGASHLQLLPSKLSISADEFEEGEEEEGDVDKMPLLQWTVPTSGEYRVVLTGAAGGRSKSSSSLQQQQKQEKENITLGGDQLVANVHLAAGQQIGLLLGKSGQCHCDQQQQQQQQQNSVCDPNGMHGCGGGGATVLFVGNDPIAIAAGGGGDFIMGRGSAATTTARVHLLEDRRARENANGLVGKGLSMMEHIVVGPQQQRQLPQQHVCTEPCIDGHVGANLTELLGGKCPRGNQRGGHARRGGHGGGGASCGPGGGGGAGYQGGQAGIFGAGQAGASAFLLVPMANAKREQQHHLLLSNAHSTRPQSQSWIIIARSNAGQGRFQLFACPQRECPPHSNCTFGKPNAEEVPSPKCICPDGHSVPTGATTCLTEPSLFFIKLFGNGQQHRATDPVPNLLLIACLLLLLLSLLLSILCCLQLCRCLRRRNKLMHCETADVHELIAIAAESAGGPAANENNIKLHCGIVGNPIYESLNLNPLPQIPRHAIRLDRIIGHGAFGEVFEGWLLLNSDGTRAANAAADGNDGGGGKEEGIGPKSGVGGQQQVKVAIKSLPIESANDFGDDFEMEARLLSQFKHENIVTLFGVSFEQQPKYIVLEFLEGGDLKNFLRENRPRQDQESVLRMGDLMAFALDVARGCEHLENTRFVHRDIAARNCLLTSKVGRRMVKIADFGMARDIYRNDYYRKGGKAFLPVRWMPPESFLDGLFTSKTDVWAFGVLLWEIFSMGYIPYSGRENHEVMRLVVAGDRLDPPIGVLSEVYDLMLYCWNTDADRRPRFSELVCTFEALLRRPELTSERLPPIRHRLANERSVSGTPSMSRAGDPHPASTTSQATVSTVLSHSAAQEATTTTATTTPSSVAYPRGSTTNSTSVYESMPTAGDGVCRAVFPPYQSRQTEETGALIQQSNGDGGNGGQLCGKMMVAGSSGGSSCSSSGSQDETLHESAGTVKLRNCIRRSPLQTTTPPQSNTNPLPEPKQQQPAAPTAATHSKKPSVPNKPAPLNLMVFSNNFGQFTVLNQQQQQQQPPPKYLAIPPGPTSATPCCWRRPSMTPPPPSPTTTASTSAGQRQQQQQRQQQHNHHHHHQQHRNHSLPPLSTTSSGRVAFQGMMDGDDGGGGGDQDSGIASARSIASADAALPMLLTTTTTTTQQMVVLPEGKPDGGGMSGGDEDLHHPPSPVVAQMGGKCGDCAAGDNKAVANCGDWRQCKK